jgi:hypothetical protein
MADQAESFEAIWQRSQTEPAAREVAVKKIEVDFSMHGTLDAFLLTADKYLAQGKIKKGEHDELIGQIATLKGVLEKMNEPKLTSETLADKAKKRALEIQDQITHLTGLFGGKPRR